MIGGIGITVALTFFRNGISHPEHQAEPFWFAVFVDDDASVFLRAVVLKEENEFRN